MNDEQVPTMADRQQWLQHILVELRAAAVALSVDSEIAKNYGIASFIGDFTIYRDGGKVAITVWPEWMPPLQKFEVSLILGGHIERIVLSRRIPKRGWVDGAIRLLTHSVLSANIEA